MLGNFNPSHILNEIYDILEEYEISPDIYYSSVVEKITDYLNDKTHGEFVLECDDYPDERGGHCAAAFNDNGHPQLGFFEYEYV